MKTKNCNNKTNQSATKNCTKKNCKSTKTSDCGGGARKTRNSADTESDSDPLGSYTGNPVGLGKYEKPVQDADDL